jgi:hypothetical protein
MLQVLDINAMLHSPQNNGPEVQLAGEDTWVKETDGMEYSTKQVGAVSDQTDLFKTWNLHTFGYKLTEHDKIYMLEDKRITLLPSFELEYGCPVD